MTTRYTYDAAGRLVKEGNKTYRYGYLDKVMSVSDGKQKLTYDYHADGQIASADYGNGKTEEFLWDGLALVHRGGEQFINEPHVGGGNPVVSSKGVSYFNDMLGTTLGTKEKGCKYSASALSAFGEDISDSSNRSPFPISRSPFFTGKPYVEGLGHAFLFRNYRASLGKWQTADPLGYPDGWNQLAYCGNMAVEAIDFLGGEIRIIKEYDGDVWVENTYLGSHKHDGRSCEIYLIETYVYHYVIAQNFNRIRRWENIDGLVDILNGIGYGLDISGGIAGITGVGSIPAVGVLIGGIVCHTVADILNSLNEYIDVPVGEPFEISKTKRKVGYVELHKFE